MIMPSKLWGKCNILIFLFWIYVGDIRVQTYTFCALIDHLPYKPFLSPEEEIKWFDYF